MSSIKMYSGKKLFCNRTHMDGCIHFCLNLCANKLRFCHKVAPGSEDSFYFLGRELLAFRNFMQKKDAGLTTL